MSAAPLFACDINTIEVFLGALGDHRRLRYTKGGVVIVPRPKDKALSRELLASVQPFLRGCYWAAVPRRDGNNKTIPAGWPYVCDNCSSWIIQRPSRATTKCPICEHKPKQRRRRLEIPWENAKRGRPDVTAHVVKILDSERTPPS